MAKKEKAPPAPRRWTPRQAQGVIGRVGIPSMLLAMAAIALQSFWLLAPAVALWIAMLVILFRYWRCPKCGKSLPKTGKTFECPKCGAKID